MDDLLKKFTQIDKMMGEELSPDLLDSLMTEGRVQFPFKPTTTSAVSQPGDQKDESPLDPDIDSMIQSVKDNEDMVKVLEDMRDDMLKDMKIPPLNKTISDAAKKLGSPDGTITAAILEKAEAITDIPSFPINPTGFDPFAGVFGNGKVTGDFINCNEASKAMFDNWERAVDAEGNITSDELHKEGSGQSVSEARDSFAKKMAEMAKYIFYMLWWEMIWPRVVLLFLENTERLLAIPIDTPFLIFRFFKKLIKPNYQKYGPIHKVLNMLKKLLLCKIPIKAWPDYNPDSDVKVWDNDSSAFVPLTEWCKNNSEQDECPQLINGDTQIELPKSWNDTGEEASWSKSDDAEAQSKSLADGLKSLFPDDPPPSCVPTRFGELFKKPEFEGPGMSPKCLDAAKTILDAVYDDAMHFGEYENSQSIAEGSLQSVLAGDVKAARQSNEAPNEEK